jgi:hypothetical protein
MIATASGLKTWKTIDITPWESAEQMRTRHLALMQKISPIANDIIEKICVSMPFEQKTATLKRVVVAELDSGFSAGARLGIIYRVARCRGLQMCSPRVGSDLRLQYKDQPTGERLFIGMEPIPLIPDPVIFVVDNQEGRLCLSAFYGGEAHIWPPETIFIFSAPE